MNSLPITSPAFTYLLNDFTHWLDVLGYAPSTTRQLPLAVREFLHYLEHLPADRHGQNITQIAQIDIPLIRSYYSQLADRKNKKRAGGLSNNYLNLHLLAIEKLLDYLRQKGKLILPKTGIPREEEIAAPVIPLSAEQVALLYQATHFYEANKKPYALRDRAMLAIYYDCGLRRNEGVMLDCKDINFDSRLVHVRHGKNNLQRFVPFSKATAKFLLDYRYEGRSRFARKPGSDTQAFFLDKHGQRIKGKELNRRLSFIQSHCQDAELKHKRLHLHLLRHSIATHLLQNGMAIENISTFLGHTTLESTQLYTHLANEYA